jgi:sulfur relay (sulfurtransferase) complex TusBCD TusD component (DsrE family)
MEPIESHDERDAVHRRLAARRMHHIRAGGRFMKLTSLWVMFVCVLSFAAPSVAPPAEAEPLAPAQRVVVHLSHATDDLHAAFMALKLAQAMQEKGAQVTLLLDLEGVRIGDTRQPNDMRSGNGEPLASHYDGLVKAGGKVLVCPHCASAVGLDTKSLRPGAQIAKDVGDLAASLLAADKILDY